MVRVGGVIGAGLLAAAVALLFSAGAAYAQTVRFDIPAGSAVASLSAWSARSGVRLDAPDAFIQGVATPAVKGEMDVRDALAAMIADTGLTVVGDDGSTIDLGSKRHPAAKFYSDPRPTYWRIADAWADPDAVVTISRFNLTYSAACGVSLVEYQLTAWELSAGFASMQPGRCLGLPAFQHYQSTLRQARRLVSQGDRLTVEGEAGTMTLTRFEPAGLEFRYWLVAQVRVGETLIAPHSDPDMTPFIIFDRDSLKGSSGCGGLYGAYRLSGRDLKLVNPEWILAGACPPNYDFKQNDRIIAALTRVRTLQPDGEAMLLKNQAGRIEMVLRPIQTEGMVQAGRQFPGL